MQNLKRRLAEKRWSKQDINKTLKIIERANKHPKIRILDKSIYWISLAVAATGNFIIAIALIPELIVLKGFLLYFSIIILGISFGLLFELLIRTIENLKQHHHILFGIIIPALAMANFVVISNNLKFLIGLENPQNPYVIGIVYAAAFILPYLIYQLVLKNEY